MKDFRYKKGIVNAKMRIYTQKIRISTVLKILSYAGMSIQ